MLCSVLLAVIAGCGGPQAPAVHVERCAAANRSRGRLATSASEPPQALVRRLGSGATQYELTDAVWLEHAPMVINEPFDCAIALAGVDTGAAIAAAARNKHNAEKADLLAATSIAPDTRRRLDDLRACGIHIFGLLWGPASALQLRIIADHFDGAGHLAKSAAFPDATRPASGDGSWSATPESVDAAFRAALQASSGDCGRCPGGPSRQ